MIVRKLGWVCLSMGLLACPPALPGGDCGGTECTAEERCESDTLLCVPDEPPVITLTAPGSVVSAPTFVVTGKITDDVSVSSAEWRSGTGAWTAIELAADGAFSITVSSPLLDSADAVIDVRASDKRTQSTAQTKATVDRVGPVIRLTRPAATDVILTATVEVAVEVTDGSEALSELIIGGVPVSAPRVGVEGVATLTIPSTLSGDAFTFEATSKDQHGNASSQLLTVTVDRAPPMVSFVAPTAAQLIAASSFTAEVLVTDPGVIQSVSFSFAGTTVAGADQGAGHWTATFSTSVEEQARVITVSATDEAGNVGTGQQMVRIDRIGPTINVSSPSAGSLERASVALSVDTAADTASVTASLGAEQATLTGGPTAWNGALTLPSADGVSSDVRITAVDQAGNMTFVDHPVLVDNVAPTVTVSAPAANSIHRAAIAVSVVTAGATDSVNATLGGQTVPLTGAATTWTGQVPIPQGDFAAAMLRVTARDLAGNSGTADVALSVDTVAPVIVFTSPTAAQKFNASQFAAGPNVTSSWTVTDDDAQAATTTVNGAASTALSVAVPTNANDNPTGYTTTVVVADRAGNTATASVSYSVDRRVPTVVSWTPAANTRNVEPRQSVISFSEPVQAALPTSPALIISGQTAPNTDVWSNGHMTYTLPLDAFPGRVLDIALANVADVHGNPVAAASRKFHMATGFANTTTTIATGVQSFEATSDGDGVISVALITTGGVLAVYKDVGGAFSSLTYPSPVAASRVAVNSSNVVNGTTLQSSHRLAVMTFNSSSAPSVQYSRSTFVDGVMVVAPTFSTPTAMVSRGPLANEPTTELFGTIVGTSYSRGTVASTLSNVGNMVIAPSNDSWAAFDVSATQVLWSHYRCRALILGGHSCGSIGYGASASTPTLLQTAMTPAGNCLATTWTSGTTRQGVFQGLSACDLVSCFDDTALPLTGSIPADLRVAPYGANGENTLLFSSRPSTLQIELSKMTAGTCGVGRTVLGQVASGPGHAPIRVGNRPGLLYLSGTTLNLYVP